jgi:hypothetical protein
MRVTLAGVHNMCDRYTPDGEGVGAQRPVTPPWDRLRAHDRRPPNVLEGQERLRVSPEFVRLHIVGISPKTYPMPSAPSASGSVSRLNCRIVARARHRAHISSSERVRARRSACREPLSSRRVISSGQRDDIAAHDLSHKQDLQRAYLENLAGSPLPPLCG